MNRLLFRYTARPVFEFPDVRQVTHTLGPLSLLDACQACKPDKPYSFSAGSLKISSIPVSLARIALKRLSSWQWVVAALCLGGCVFRAANALFVPELALETQVSAIVQQEIGDSE
jgi:hypothetical protein